jgi:DNA repair protein SbcD/Mre11
VRILHTADWHLGKNLEGFSRLSEQEQFIEELISICNNEKIDLIIIAGDVFDTINPPALAEKLFYRSLKELSLNGERPIIAIAGNHDNHERLVASSPLASELGIILIGSYTTLIEKGKYGTNCIVENCGEGFISIDLKGEKLVALTMPYASESRLNKLMFTDVDESEVQKSYSNKISEMFEANEIHYTDDSINIAIGHFHITNGEITNSERDISLGGVYAVNYRALPAKSQYIAMGHLHRMQKIKKSIYYSGSPIQYSKSEASHEKYVNVVDLKAGIPPIINKVKLTNYKPIEVWKVNGIENAIEMCQKNTEKDCWVYLEITTTRPLVQSEIKEMKTLKKDIVEIYPIILNTTEERNFETLVEEKTPYDEFKDFYYDKFGVHPEDELVETFTKIWNENEEEHEVIL